MPSSRRSSSRNSAYPSDATITRPRSGRRDTRDLDSAPSSDDNDVNARALSRPGRAQRKADVISDDSDSMSDSSDSQSASATAQHDLEKGQNRVSHRMTLMGQKVEQLLLTCQLESESPDRHAIAALSCSWRCRWRCDHA